MNRRPAFVLVVADAHHVVAVVPALRPVDRPVVAIGLQRENHRMADVDRVLDVVGLQEAGLVLDAKQLQGGRDPGYGRAIAGRFVPAALATASSRTSWPQPASTQATAHAPQSYW